jgi:hypothetical protein
MTFSTAELTYAVMVYFYLSVSPASSFAFWMSFLNFKNKGKGIFMVKHWMGRLPAEAASSSTPSITAWICFSWIGFPWAWRFLAYPNQKDSGF